MTLPFRLRHHDAEASHDRARALLSDGFNERLAEADAAWLDDHLARCPECRAEHEGFAADRALLRGLRDRPPEPPRDLWAGTRAAIEAESRSRRGRLPGVGQILPPPGGIRRFPLGVLAGALVVLVVVGTALLPRGGSQVNPPSSAGSVPVAVASGPASTQMALEANRVAWVQRAADGSYSLVFADVDHACPPSDPSCAPLADSSPAPLKLTAPPQAVVLSPVRPQIAVVGAASETAGSVLIVDVPAARPSATPGPTPPQTVRPATPPPTANASLAPSGSVVPSPIPGAKVIITGVTVVGPVGFSGDGDWLAFSARPKDGPGGPDLYLWHTGDEQARRVTTDGATFFAGWYGNLVLASGIVSQPPVDGASPVPSLAPEPTGEATASPSDGSSPPAPASPASPEASPATTPEASPTVATIEAHPYSFLLDPTTGARDDFALPDVWMPSIDPTGRFVTYWSGTVAATGPTGATSGPFAFEQVTGWRPATGHLVLDGWTSGLTPPPSASASPPETASAASSGPASSDGQPSSTPASREPEGTAPPAGTAEPSAAPSGSIPGLHVGPTGTPIELAAGPIADFDARFDPSGRRLAIWVLDTPESSAGRLWLVALDPVAGHIDPAVQPMAAPGVQALRGFTIDTGRLAWATPVGQDGQPSSVQVLAWKGDEFGQVESVPGGNPQIVR